MRRWVLAFAFGVAVAGFAPALPAWPVIPLLFIPGLLALRYRVLVLPAAACLGMGWLLLLAGLHQQRLLPAALEQVDLRVRGTVIGLPRATAHGTRFLLAVDTACAMKEMEEPGQTGKKAPCPHATPAGIDGKLLLNDYGRQRYLPGQVIALTVRLKRPHGFANPGGFDYERWLFQQRIIATGYVRNADGNTRVSAAAGFAPARQFDRLRARFQRQLARPALQAPGFLGALTIGDRQGISATDWRLLSLTGTNHLMVISGLHISLVAWLAYRLGLLVLSRSTALTGRCPAQRLACVPALLAACGYAGLAGFSLPVQRALVMVCCVMAGQALSRSTRPGNSLCLALAAVLLLDPLAPQSGGFWMSFLAVACLLMTLQHEAAATGTPMAKLRLLMRTQGLLFLGMAPVIGFLFLKVSLLAPLVNLLAIPLVGMVVVPLCLLAVVVGLVSPAHVDQALVPPDFLLDVFTRALAFCASHLAALQLDFPALPLWLTAAAVMGLGVACRLRGWGRYLVLASVLAAVALYRPQRPAPGEFSVDILDVGQGLAVVIATHGHVLVYDTGPAYSARFDAGGGIIVPFLQRRRLGRPDRVMVSHGDNDHAGGLAGLVEAYPGLAVTAGEGIGRQPVLPCRRGQGWRWDGVRFDVLAPLVAGATGNNASCVLKVSSGNHAVLLPGDIEQSVELAMVRQYREVLAADVLIAPHHGSKTSSTTPFIRHVGPSWVVFTTGYLNRFRHPDDTVTARYRRLGVATLNTATTGAVHIAVGGDGIAGRPQLYRRERPRFWSASARP